MRVLNVHKNTCPYLFSLQNSIALSRSVCPAPSPLISGSRKKNRSCAVAPSKWAMATHPDGTPLCSRIYMLFLSLSNWFTKLCTPSMRYALQISEVNPYSDSYNTRLTGYDKVHVTLPERSDGDIRGRPGRLSLYGIHRLGDPGIFTRVCQKSSGVTPHNRFHFPIVTFPIFLQPTSPVSALHLFNHSDPPEDLLPFRSGSYVSDASYRLFCPV